MPIAQHDRWYSPQTDGQLGKWSERLGTLGLLVASLLSMSCGADLNGGGSCSPDCASGYVCRNSACVPQNPCSSNDDCQGDTFCQGGTCVPYADGSADNACGRLVPAGLLSPSIFCEWTGPEAGDPFPNHKQVLSTPLVVDFNFDGHRSSEFPTIRPSIVINTYDNATDGACGLGPAGDGANYGIIRVLDGRTCKQQFAIPTHVNGAITPAIGDLDGDGIPDIVAHSVTGGLVAFKFAVGQNKFIDLWTSKTAAGAASNPVAGSCQWAGPTLADLDNDGKPEALLEGYIYDSTGKLVDGTLGLLGSANGQFPIVADVDKDGVPNLITSLGQHAYNTAQRRWDVKFSYTEATRGSANYAAVGDFGTVSGNSLDRASKDGQAEVVIVSAGKVAIVAHNGTRVFGPVSLPGSAGGGPPTVGDFDNDGRPEFAAAGSNSYTVFDPDCVAGSDAKFCPTKRTDGILWSSTSQDKSSNITGSSLFDFEGNGTSEAIYADECFARIYDGATGEVLFSQAHSSCTWNENPVVADVAGNFRSKLIVPSNMNCPTIVCPAVDPVFKGLRCSAATDCPNGLPCDSGFCRCTADTQCNTAASGGGFVCKPAPVGVSGAGSTCQAAFQTKRSGIRVFGDGLDRWVASRPLWNQHAYSVTNVNDDGVIPPTNAALRNWESAGLNNFRQNVQGKLAPSAAPDITARVAGTGTCSGGMVTLSTQVCNRGNAPVVDGSPVTFYEGTTRVCTGTTKNALPPGACAVISCSGPSSAGNHEITVVADDDGTGAGQTSECYEANNRASFAYSC